MAEEHNKGYRHPGDIEIDAFKLVSSGGQVFDIGPMVLEFSVFEDIGTPYMECEVVLSDALSLLDDLVNGFTGTEICVVSFRSKDDSVEFRNHCFVLNALGDRIRVDEKIEAYSMRGVSVECIMAARHTLSRSYGPNTISNMIASIHKEFLASHETEEVYGLLKDATGVSISKDFQAASTSGIQRFIIPSMNIEDTIGFLSDEADSDTHKPFFVFFENATGFHFADIVPYLGHEAVTSLKYEPSNFKDEKSEDATAPYNDPFKIINFRVVRQTDLLDRMRGGEFSSKTINIDVLRKKQSTSYFDAPGAPDGTPVVNVSTTRKGHDNDKMFAAEKPLPKRVNKFIGEKMSIRKRMFDTVMELTIPGNSDLKAGDVINLDIPVATDLTDKSGENEKYVSGRYIITSIRHKMQGKSGGYFFNFIMCARIHD